MDRTDLYGNKGAVRAFPPRMVHMLAGNAPSGCVASIAQGALVKAVNLFKMPSSDPFTTVAVLRTMAEIDPKHPVVQSMSAVYWQGGDTVDRAHALSAAVLRQDRRLGWRRRDQQRDPIPGPGNPIDLVRSQVVDLDDRARGVRLRRTRVADVAERLAADTTVFNQEACLASRFAFVEGERAQVESLCAELAERLAVDREFAVCVGPAAVGGDRATRSR